MTPIFADYDLGDALLTVLVDLLHRDLDLGPDHGAGRPVPRPRAVRLG